MAKMAAEPMFVDTNSLVYVGLRNSPFHAAAASRLESLHAGGVELWLSRQVIREYLATMSKAHPQRVVDDLILGQVRTLAARFRIAEEGPNVANRLIQLLAEVPTGSRQVHDANIVATMLEHRIPRLLTHNVADFRRSSRWVAVIPLLA